MSWSSVRVITPPTAQPITVADVKLRLDVVRTDQDNMIEKFIDGAVARLDGPDGIGIALLRQKWRLSYDHFPYQITVLGWPVVSIDSVNYRDRNGNDQVVDPALYRVDMNSDPVRIVPRHNNHWPYTDHEIGAVWVDYKVGFETPAKVPADLIDAISLFVGHRYENREATAVGVSVSALSLSYRDILNTYTRLRVTS